MIPWFNPLCVCWLDFQQPMNRYCRSCDSCNAPHDQNRNLISLYCIWQIVESCLGVGNVSSSMKSKGEETDHHGIKWLDADNLGNGLDRRLSSHHWNWCVMSYICVSLAWSYPHVYPNRGYHHDELWHWICVFPREINGCGDSSKKFSTDSKKFKFLPDSEADEKHQARLEILQDALETRQLAPLT